MQLRRLLPWLVALTLVVGSVVVVLATVANDRAVSRNSLDRVSSETSAAATALTTALQGRITDLGSFFDASKHVTAQEFSGYTDPLLDDSGAASLSWIELVEGSDRLAAERRLDTPIDQLDAGGTHVHAADRARYAVTTYIKTPDDSTALIGTDVLADPIRGAVLRRAGQTSSPQSTGLVMLHGTAEPGFVIYEPVYGPGALPSAVRKPIGFVAASFRFDDLAPQLSATLPDGAGAQIRVDGKLAISLGRIHGTVARDQVSVAGHPWRIAVSAPPTPAAFIGLSRPVVASLLGLLLTLLITAFTRLAVVAAGRADEVAGLRQAERDQAIAEREISERATREFLSHLPEISVQRFDADLRIVSAGGGLFERRGWDADMLVGRTLFEAYPADRLPDIEGPMRRALAGEASAFALPGITSDHSYWVQMVPMPGDEPGGLWVTSDVSALLESEDARETAELRLERTFDSAPVGMNLVGQDGRFAQVNKAMCRITGYSEEQLLTMGPKDLIHPDDTDVTRRQMEGLLTGRTGALDVEKRYLHADGHCIWIALHATILLDGDGQTEYILAHVVDVTDRHEFADQLQHLADHDPLTDLRNRRSFESALETQIAIARRYGAEGALLLLDLDHFKAVNDTFGHAAGDAVLTTVADTLRSCLRASDTIGRLGGDEFAVLLPKADGHEAEIVAGKLVEQIRELGTGAGDPGVARGVTVSIGAVVLREHHASADAAFAAADRALYDTKGAGRDGYAFSDFEPVEPLES